MYKCPSCSGELRFDIESQSMKCTQCEQFFEPYLLDTKNASQEESVYDVTLFTCPNCGGEIYSTDTTVASFCSYCASSCLLESRISSLKKPNKIITFKKTKEDCKKIYKDRLRKSFFAPDYLKDPNYIDSFRGIYIPYWLYNISQKSDISLTGSRTHRSGDYKITDHYVLSGKIDAEYRGISHDASSTFDDSISECLSPYESKELNDFNPAFLSGFYADTYDVHKNTYEHFATSAATAKTSESILFEPGFSGININSRDLNDSETYNTQTDNTEIALFPVWFLSHQKDGRVTYTTINGQTGKIVADIPISIPKYLAFSSIIATILFVILNLCFTFTPKVLLAIIGVISPFVAFTFSNEMFAIYKKDLSIFDLGKAKINLNSEKKSPDSFYAVSGTEIGVIFAALIIGMFGITFNPIFAIVLISTIICGAFSNAANRQFKNINGTSFTPICWATMISQIISLIIIVFNPVADMYYYTAAAFALCGTLITLINIIRYYNTLATRRLPQFAYKGGDNRA